VTFTYTASGRRASMADASGTTTYAYDARDRLVVKATPRGTLSYGYDGRGNLLSIRSSNVGGASVDYAYDALGRLASVTDPSLPAGANATTYNHDANGNLSSQTFPNRVTSGHTHDSLDRDTRISIRSGVSALADYAHTFDPAGNRVSVAELGGRTVNYTYDSSYRLVSEAISGDPFANNGTSDYVYDAASNRVTRTSSVSAVPSTSYAYDANDRLTSDAYDDNGNTIAAGGTTFAYDFENRIKSLNDGAVTFLYDGDSNRVAKTAGGVTTFFLVDDRNPTGYAQVLEELVGGSMERVYTYGLDLISQQVPGGSTRFYHHDGQGSVRLLTDTAASPTDAYDYEAFGGTVRSMGSTPNSYLFRSQQFDPTVDSYYLRARYYRTGTGRFLTQDSWSGDALAPNTLHSYAYPSNNPVMLADPTGHIGLVDVGITLGIASILSDLPNATPISQRTPQGGLEWKQLAINMVVWPGLEGAIGYPNVSASWIFGKNGAKISVRTATWKALEEEDVRPLMTGGRGISLDGTQSAIRKLQDLQRIERSPGRITVYVIPCANSGASPGLTKGRGLGSRGGSSLGWIGPDPTVFLCQNVAQDLGNTLAHELGHALGITYDYDSNLYPSRTGNLMYHVESEQTGTALLPAERTLLNRNVDQRPTLHLNVPPP